MRASGTGAGVECSLADLMPAIDSITGITLRSALNVVLGCPLSDQPSVTRFNVQLDCRMVPLDGPAALVTPGPPRQAERIEDAVRCSGKGFPCYGDRPSLLSPTLSLFRNNRESGAQPIRNTKEILPKNRQ